MPQTRNLLGRHYITRARTKVDGCCGPFINLPIYQCIINNVSMYQYAPDLAARWRATRFESEAYLYSLGAKYKTAVDEAGALPGFPDTVYWWWRGAFNRWVRGNHYNIANCLLYFYTVLILLRICILVLVELQRRSKQYIFQVLVRLWLVSRATRTFLTSTLQ